MRIIISGGGTGGHIFPAIAIANALKKINSSTEILFVGAAGRMEMEKVPAAGYKIEKLWISGLQRRLTFGNFLFPIKVLLSIIKARMIIKNFKPDVAVGTGGYASGPLLHVASVRKIPCLIQEQNSFPGITNKILSRKVNKICVAYDGMEKYFPKEKIIVTGNPVRQDILLLKGKKQGAMDFFKLDPKKKTLFVMGGSLGARTINESILRCLDLLVKNNIQLIWQTGKGFFAVAKETVKKYETNEIRVFDFISRMDLSYAAADIVVSRAGAIAISELAVAKKPAILIPSPNVAEDHQTKNAMALVKHDAAILIKDAEAKEKLGEEIIRLMNDTLLQNKIIENINKFTFPDAAETIAKEIINLVKDKK
ncbi:MAG: undecaprenyldiphospho-muramoylpentapeptide beta-N-acetylglucosaminyltransferase [Bacteroidota bacterium]